MTCLALKGWATEASLIADLWGPAAEPRALDALKFCWKELAEQLGAYAITTTHLNGEKRYQLNDSLIAFLDVQRVLYLVKLGRLDEALQLYRGDFLHALPQTAWIDFNRREVHYALLDGLRGAAQSALAAGEQGQATFYLMALSRLNPEAEELKAFRVRLIEMFGSSRGRGFAETDLN